MRRGTCALCSLPTARPACRSTRPPAAAVPRAARRTRSATATCCIAPRSLRQRHSARRSGRCSRSSSASAPIRICASRRPRASRSSAPPTISLAGAPGALPGAETGVEVSPAALTPGELRETAGAPPPGSPRQRAKAAARRRGRRSRMADAALRTGGEAIVLGGARMPSKACAAALFRDQPRPRVRHGARLRLRSDAPSQQIARQDALTLARPEITIRGSFSRRGTQAVNGSRL
jgi:hypothetical protein